jgi:hypothetical protein
MLPIDSHSMQRRCVRGIGHGIKKAAGNLVLGYWPILRHLSCFKCTFLLLMTDLFDSKTLGTFKEWAWTAAVSTLRNLQGRHAADVKDVLFKNFSDS